MSRAQLNLAISAVAAVVFAYLAFRSIDLHAVRAALGEVELWWGLPYLLMLGLGQLFRTWRWQVLLRPITTLPARRLWPIATLGYTAIFAIPWLGELVRPYLVRQESRQRGEKVRGSAALATVVVERVLDGLVVSMGAAVALLPLVGRPRTPIWVLPVALGALSVFLGAFGFLALAAWKHELAVRLTDRTLGLVSQRLAERAVSILDAFLEGLKALPSRQTALGCVALTVVYWVINAAAMYVLGKGFRLGLDWAAVWGTMGIIIFGFLVPSGPGQVGNFHFFAGQGLSLFIAPQLAGRGTLFVVVVHAAQVIWYLSTGLVALLAGHLSAARVLEGAAEELGSEEGKEVSEPKMDVSADRRRSAGARGS
jgi:uncharacterized membrane protein YbhN (UPF0104 family)